MIISGMENIAIFFENIGYFQYFCYFRYMSDIFNIFILQHWIG